ncbi:MAG: endonuclease/exonuclease/phosphatase family protein [Burkholderiales bacterium]|nr:endonuclease/exonuclease/phosphatase family protein [Burkholderiales bacterium]
MLRIASFNVENLFARPKAFRSTDLTVGKPVLDAYRSVNQIFKKSTYTDADKAKIVELLVTLDIYFVNGNGAVRRRNSLDPRWAWLRKNRGSFDREPQDATKSIEIIANGRDDWIGWVELAKEPTDETGTRMTARVIEDVGADILAVVEAEDRPSLVRFNEELLQNRYGHVMLIDGNDDRGIDVAIMTRAGFGIETIRSNVDATDDHGTIFSRDCPQYEIRTPAGNEVHVLVNHFKSQSGGGGDKRQRQASRVREIVDGLVQRGKHVVVLGDLNEGPPAEGSQAPNLAPLFDNDSPLVDCYSLGGFDDGGKPGTYDSCGLRNRLDYILISKNLQPSFKRGGLFRKGLWGSRVNRPTAWETYEEMTDSSEQASDHAAVFLDLDI